MSCENLSIVLAVAIGVVAVLLLTCWKDSGPSRRASCQSRDWVDNMHAGKPHEQFQSNPVSLNCDVGVKKTDLNGALKVNEDDYNALMQKIALEDSVAEGHQQYLDDGAVPSLMPNRRLQETDHSIDLNSWSGIGALMSRKAMASGASTVTVMDGQRSTHSTDLADMNIGSSSN